MNKKKNIGRFFLLLAVVLIFAMVFTACGNSNNTEEVKITVSFTPTENFYLGNISASKNDSGDNYSLKKGEDFTLELIVGEGWNHKNISFTAGSKVVTASVVYNDDSSKSISESEHVDYSRVRICKYKMSNVTEDLAVNIDVSNCKKAEIELTVEDSLAEASYALVKDLSDNTFVTQLNSEIIETVKSIPQEGKITVPYGKSLLFFTDDENGIKSQETYGVSFNCLHKANVNGQTFKYSNKYVYLLQEAKVDVTLSKAANENDGYDYKVEVPNLFTTAYPDVNVTGEQIKINSFVDTAETTDSTQYGNETYTLNGKTLANSISMSGSGYYIYAQLYLGNAANAGLDEYLSQNEVGNQTRSTIGSKTYLKVKAVDSSLYDNVDFYLSAVSDVSKAEQGQKIALELQTAEDGTKFIVVTRDLVSAFVKDLKQDGFDCKTGFLFVSYTFNETFFNNQNTLGFTVEKNLVDGDAYVRLSAGNGGYYNHDYGVINDNKTIYYFNRDKLFTDGVYNNNAIVTLVGLSSGIVMPRYSSVVCEIYSVDGNGTKTLIKTGTGSQQDIENGAMVLDLSSVAANHKMLHISLSYNQTPYDTSEHIVDFSSLLANGKTLFVKTSVTGEWTTVTAETSTIKLTSGNTLYYYLANSTSSINFALEYDDIILSVNGSATDLFNRSMLIDGESVDIRYITLNGSYLSEGVTLKAGAEQ